MEQNLVIVESPAKAKTIKKYLGDDFIVLSSYGHVRDLAKKDMGIDIENNFTPKYVVPTDKKKIITELKKNLKNVTQVWLASDEDREGEAISWHLVETLGLDINKTKRIVFHEITKDAILKAINNPREVDMNLVNAQQARRVLDRLVGFKLSPLLWKKIKPSLSAGRVQSVAVKLIVEKEREINNHTPESFYKIVAVFNSDNKEFKAELNQKFKILDEARDFLEKCKSTDFYIDDIKKTPGYKKPAAPFTTSTLQQEASRKLRFSVSQTMRVAQKLYENGHITYMRTDSVNLSNLAMSTAKKVVISDFGQDYYKSRKFNTKSKGAQEAHEAIRPTFIANKNINGTSQEEKLYDLIWKRTVASQMAEAQIEKTNISIKSDNFEEKFIATGEVIKFEGFLSLYLEATEDCANEEIQSLLPNVTLKQKVNCIYINAINKYSNPSPRYSEAGLVKKMEELGIGRPSTYAPIISTIQQREYVIKDDPKYKTREITNLVLKNNDIIAEQVIEKYGGSKSKLMPTSMGLVVTDYLSKNFTDIMNYNFTAEVEKQFDQISYGNKEWQQMIKEFYQPFDEHLQKSLNSTENEKYEREIGTDPKTGKIMTVKVGRYGPYVQIGPNDEEEKPVYASLRKNQNIENITFEEALELFKLPRNLGAYEEQDVTVAIGRFGPYIKHNSKFYSLKKSFNEDPYVIELDRAVELIEYYREQERLYPRTFESIDGLTILKGRYGPYIIFDEANYKIPRTMDPAIITADECMQLINDAKAKTKIPKTKKTKAKK